MHFRNIFSVSLRKILLTLIIVSGVFNNTGLKAQETTSCGQKLVDAQEEFASGRIELVPEILENCLTNGLFSKQEQVAAYRLLTLCHLYYNRTPEAAKTMQQLLKIDKEYEIQDIDPSEFINLYATFRTTPVVIIGVKGGFGALLLYDRKNYNDNNSINSLYNYSTEKPIFSVGLSAEIPIRASYSVVAEIYAKRYQYSYKKLTSNYADILFNDKLTSVEIPILAQWNILTEGDFIPYVNLGGTFDFLLEKQSDKELSKTDNLGSSKREPKINDFINNGDRNIFNYAFTAGAGIRIKNILGRNYFTFDVRYSRYFNTQVNSNIRADDRTSTYAYYYTDNTFKFQNFQLLFGFKKPFYIPKQRKSATKKE